MGCFRSSLMPGVYTQVHEVRHRSRGPHERRGVVTFPEGEAPPCRRGPPFEQISTRKIAPSPYGITCSTFVARFCSTPALSISRRRDGHQRTIKSQLQQVRMAAFRAVGNRTGREVGMAIISGRRRLSPRPALQSAANAPPRCRGSPLPEKKSARISRHIFASTSCRLNFRWRLNPADRRMAPSSETL